MDMGMTPSQYMQVQQMYNTDYQNAQTIQTQIYASNAKNRMDIWKILQDVQTKKHDTYQEVTFDRAKSGQKMLDKWDSFVKG